MPIPLPEGITVLPVAGKEASIAYMVRYLGQEVGKVEREIGRDKERWKYWGQGLLCYIKGNTEDLRTALEFIFTAVDKVIKKPKERRKSSFGVKPP